MHLPMNLENIQHVNIERPTSNGGGVDTDHFSRFKGSLRECFGEISPHCSADSAKRGEGEQVPASLRMTLFAMCTSPIEKVLKLM